METKNQPQSEMTTEGPKERYERKRRRINVSLAPGDFNRLVKAAHQDGCKRTVVHTDPKTWKEKKSRVPAPAIYLRKVALAHLDQAPIIPETLYDEINSLRMEIRRCGNNINQAVKLAQIKNKKASYSKIENELREARDNIREMDARLEQFLTRKREKA